jgi:hypothetical protein
MLLDQYYCTPELLAVTNTRVDDQGRVNVGEEVLQWIRWLLIQFSCYVG